MVVMSVKRPVPSPCSATLATGETRYRSRLPSASRSLTSTSATVTAGSCCDTASNARPPVFTETDSAPSGPRVSMSSAPSPVTSISLMTLGVGAGAAAGTSTEAPKSIWPAVHSTATNTDTIPLKSLPGSSSPGWSTRDRDGPHPGVRLATVLPGAHVHASRQRLPLSRAPVLTGFGELSTNCMCEDLADAPAFHARLPLFRLRGRPAPHAHRTRRFEATHLLVRRRVDGVRFRGWADAFGLGRHRDPILVDALDSARVVGRDDVPPPVPLTQWRFDGDDAASTAGRVDGGAGHRRARRHRRAPDRHEQRRLPAAVRAAHRASRSTRRAARGAGAHEGVRRRQPVVRRQLRGERRAGPLPRLVDDPGGHGHAHRAGRRGSRPTS